MYVCMQVQSSNAQAQSLHIIIWSYHNRRPQTEEPSQSWNRRFLLLARRQHFSAWNDVMAAILQLWRHSVNRWLFMWQTSVPNFIPIRFETTEPCVIVENTTITTTPRWVGIWDQFQI